MCINIFFCAGSRRFFRARLLAFDFGLANIVRPKCVGMNVSAGMLGHRLLGLLCVCVCVKRLANTMSKKLDNGKCNKQSHRE